MCARICGLHLHHKIFICSPYYHPLCYLISSPHCKSFGSTKYRILPLLFLHPEYTLNTYYFLRSLKGWTFRNFTRIFEILFSDEVDFSCQNACNIVKKCIFNAKSFWDKATALQDWKWTFSVVSTMVDWSNSFSNHNFKELS